jgi:hypothetical protein
VDTAPKEFLLLFIDQASCDPSTAELGNTIIVTL